MKILISMLTAFLIMLIATLCTTIAIKLMIAFGSWFIALAIIVAFLLMTLEVYTTLNK